MHISSVAFYYSVRGIVISISGGKGLCIYNEAFTLKVICETSRFSRNVALVCNIHVEEISYLALYSAYRVYLNFIFQQM